MDILTKIIEKKKERIAMAKADISLAALRREVRCGEGGRFRQALSRTDRINIIAEVKKASPSKGIIRDDFNPVAIAQEYQEGGAAAISVLTEEDFFQGSLQILRNIRAHCSLPLLRKDFIIEEYQVYEAAQAGADAFLLIAAALSATQLTELIACGQEIGLDSLIEVHTAQELEKVLNCQAEIIGVNNRNLKTFAVDLTISLQLVKEMPKNSTLVSESGINRASDIQLLRDAGYHAFLVGENLMRASSPGQALRALIE